MTFGDVYGDDEDGGRGGGLVMHGLRMSST